VEHRAVRVRAASWCVDSGVHSGLGDRSLAEWPGTLASRTRSLP
jgi:hypothetical protein